LGSELLRRFYEAEKVHQNYYKDNKSLLYVITPKIDKLKKMFEDKLKNNEEKKPWPASY
jgi:peptide methionine sulfoxide reductase MsrA